MTGIRLSLCVERNPMQVSQKQQKYLLFCLETLLPFCLLGAKFWALNSGMLHLGSFVLPMTAFSLVLLCAFCLFVRIVLRRDSVPPFMVLYGVISVLMLVDAVYCGYTGKLPSVVMLQYTWQLGDVKEAIFENVTWTRLLYAIDVPLWMVYFIFFRKKLHNGISDIDRTENPDAEKKAAYIQKSSATCFFGAAFTVSAVLCIGYCVCTPFIPSYFKSELMTYHVLDACSAIVPKQEAIPTLAQLTEGEGETENPAYYEGIAKGRNVITVQVEALQNFVIGAYYNGQEITPNLNAMIAGDTLYFDHYYYQIGGGNTADAEFAVNNSLYAPDTEAAYAKYPDNDYYSMATLLKENGYAYAAAFHGYLRNFWYRDIAYPGQGYDEYLSGSDYYLEPDEVAGMGVSDGEFFVRAVDYMEKQKEIYGDDPFYAFLITLSSHYAFELDERFYTLTLAPEDEGTLYGNYLQSIHYVDTAFGMFIDALKEAGLYDNSIITIYGDHFGLPVYKWECKAFLTQFLGHEYTYADHFNVPLIMHIPGSGVTETISKTGGHIDVMPTLLSLLGLENTKGIMFGQNLLGDSDGIVYEQTHLARGSFISDEVLFQYPFTGIAPNAKANAMDTWEEIDASQYTEISEKAQKEIALCMYLLEHNLVLRDRYQAAAEE